MEAPPGRRVTGNSPLERASAMIGRIAREARSVGISDAEAERLGEAARLAFEHRRARLRRDGPDLLHPGRTILILLGDGAERNPTVLTAAALFDSHCPELEPPSTLAAVLSSEAAALAGQVATPARSGDSLAEALLLAEPHILRLALAERLDHARHLHLRPRDEWAALHESVATIYLPLAERAEPALARRLRWWAGTFERRWGGAGD